jgi:hypothetical protein
VFCRESAPEAGLISSGRSEGTVKGTEIDGTEDESLETQGFRNPPFSFLRTAPKVGSAGVPQSSASWELGTQPRPLGGPMQATGRSETVIVSSSPASARRRTAETLLRSSLWEIVATNPRY